MKASTAVAESEGVDLASEDADRLAVSAVEQSHAAGRASMVAVGSMAEAASTAGTGKIRVPRRDANGRQHELPAVFVLGTNLAIALRLATGLRQMATS